MDKQENTLLLTSQSCSFSSIRSATKLVFDIRRKIAITIPERMCADHDSLESVVFKSPVKKIERYAFSNCPRLQEVIFEQSVSSIDYNAFSNCPAAPAWSTPMSDEGHLRKCLDRSTAPFRSPPLPAAPPGMQRSRRVPPSKWQFHPPPFP